MLREIGLKGSLLNNSLYFALSVYEQQRTDFSAQATVTNQASQTQGAEFEMRWVASERLLLTLGYSDMEVINLNTLDAGSRFSFIGADDVPGIPPESIYGGALAGSVIRPGPERRPSSRRTAQHCLVDRHLRLRQRHRHQRQRRRRGRRPFGFLQFRDPAGIYACQCKHCLRERQLDSQRGGQEPSPTNAISGRTSRISSAAWSSCRNCRATTRARVRYRW